MATPPDSAGRVASRVAVAVYMLVVVLALFTQPVGKVAIWIFCGLVGWAAMRWGYRKLFERLVERLTRS